MMRIPRLRFRIRWLMVVVAVTGIGLGSYLGIDRLIRRSTEFRRSAQVQKRGETFYISQADLFRKMVKVEEDLLKATRIVYPNDAWRIQQVEQNVEKWRAEEYRYQRKAGHHAFLHEKYLQAAASPWKSIAPDPPEPD